MRGELIEVWSATWSGIWVKLAKDTDYGRDFISDLCRELIPEPAPPEKPPEPVEFTEDGDLVRPEDIEARSAYDDAFREFNSSRARREEAVSGGANARNFLNNALKTRILSEGEAVSALERAHRVVTSYGDHAFENKYFVLVESFLQRYSLRYDLRRPFTMHPTLPGIFSKLIHELRMVTSQDPDLDPMMRGFEDAVRDLRLEASPNRMKTCFQKQFNLLEALASKHPDVEANTLGQMCGELNTWPHATVREAAKKIYGFRAYPGVGHGAGTGALREIEMRDLIAISVLLAGLSPYLTDRLDASQVYLADIGA